MHSSWQRQMAVSVLPWLPARGSYAVNLVKRTLSTNSRYSLTIEHFHKHTFQVSGKFKFKGCYALVLTDDCCARLNGKSRPTPAAPPSASPHLQCQCTSPRGIPRQRQPLLQATLPASGFQGSIVRCRTYTQQLLLSRTSLAPLTHPQSLCGWPWPPANTQRAAQHDLPPCTSAPTARNASAKACLPSSVRSSTMQAVVAGVCACVLEHHGVQHGAHALPDVGRHDGGHLGAAPRGRASRR